MKLANANLLENNVKICTSRWPNGCGLGPQFKGPRVKIPGYPQTFEGFGQSVCVLCTCANISLALNIKTSLIFRLTKMYNMDDEFLIITNSELIKCL